MDLEGDEGRTWPTNSTEQSYVMSFEVESPLDSREIFIEPAAVEVGRLR